MIFVLKRKWDAEAVRMYQEGLEKQLKEAIREAKKAEKEAKKAVVSAEAQGEHKKAIETALKLREMSLSLEQIAEVTGLTINEIEKLK